MDPGGDRVVAGDQQRRVDVEFDPIALGVAEDRRGGERADRQRAGRQVVANDLGAVEVDGDAVVAFDPQRQRLVGRRGGRQEERVPEERRVVPDARVPAVDQRRFVAVAETQFRRPRSPRRIVEPGGCPVRRRFDAGEVVAPRRTGGEQRLVGGRDGVGRRVLRDRSSEQPRVGAVGRVIDGLAGRERQRGPGRDVAAVLGRSVDEEFGGVDARVQRRVDGDVVIARVVLQDQFGAAELIDDQRRTLRNVVRPQSVERVDPVLPGAGGRRRPPAVAPPRRFGDHGGVDLRGGLVEQRLDALGRQRALVEERVLDRVGEPQSVFVVGHQLLMQPLRVEIVRRRLVIGVVVRTVAVLAHVAERVFGVVLEEPEALASGAVADAEEVVRPAVVENEIADRGVQVAAVDRNHHVIDQVVDIDQHRQVRVVDARRIEPLHGEVVDVVDERRRDAVGGAGDRGGPQLVPRVGVAVDGLDAFEIVARFDDVVVPCVAAEIRFGVIGVGPFLGLEHAPVLAVEIQVEPRASGVRLAQFALGAAGEQFGDEVVVGIAGGRPGIVLGGPQVELFEGRHAAVAVDRVIQFALAVRPAEVKLEGVFRVEIVAAVTAADSQPRVNLEPGRAVRVDPLGRCRAFPIATVLAGVAVDANLGVEQVVQVGADRDRRDRPQRVFDGRRPLGVDHVRVHPVIDFVGVPRRGPTGRRLIVVALRQHVVQKQVRPRDAGGRHPIGAERRGANDRRRRHVQRPGINGAAGRRRFAAVGRVPDRRRGVGVRERDGLGRVVKTGVPVDRHRGQDAFDGVDVRSGRRRRGEERRPGGIVQPDPRQRRVEQQRRVRRRRVQQLDRQHVRPGDERRRRKRDRFRGNGFAVAAGRRRGGRGRDRRRRVPPRDFDAVDPGDEAVVVPGVQTQRVQRPRVGDVERQPQIGRRGRITDECTGDVGVDDGVRAAAEMGGRQTAAGNVADQPHRIIERRKTAGSGEHLDAGTAGGLEHHQFGRVGAGRKVERLQRVRRGALPVEFRGERSARTGQPQPKTVVAVDAEGVIARRRNLDIGHRPDDELVDVVADRLGGERIVAAEVLAAAGAQIIHRRCRFDRDGLLIRRGRQNRVGVGQRIDDAVKPTGRLSFDIRDLKTRRDDAVADAADGARPRRIVVGRRGPHRRRRRRRHGPARNGERPGGGVIDQRLDHERRAITDVGRLCGEGGRELANHVARVVPQRQIFTTGGQLEIGVQFVAGYRAVFVAGEYDHRLAGRQHGGRERPMIDAGVVVGQLPTAQVDVGGGRVVNLDPVRRIAVLVAEPAGIGGHEFGNDGSGGHHPAAFKHLRDQTAARSTGCRTGASSGGGGESDVAVEERKTHSNPELRGCPIRPSA